MRTSVVTALIVALQALLPAHAVADPLTIVGGAAALGHDRGLIWTLTSHRLDVYNARLDPAEARGLAVACAAGCAPGSVVDLGLDTAGDMALGTGILLRAGSGTPIDMIYRGDWTFTAPSMRLPATADGPLVMAAPFTFAGTLAGTGSGVDIAHTLRGRGRVELSLLESGGLYRPMSPLVYRFDTASDSSAPTPEPGSILLFGSGAIGLALRRRRRALEG